MMPLVMKNCVASLLVVSIPLLDLMVLIVVLNWFSTMLMKDFNTCNVLLLMLKRCVQVDLV